MKVRKSLATILSLVLVFLSIPLQVSAVEEEHIFTHEELACMEYVPAEECTTDVEDTLIPIKNTVNTTKGTTTYYIIECNDGYMLTNPSGTTFSRTRYNSGALQYKKWKFTEDSNGDYIVYSYSNSTKCLTVNPTTKAVSLSTYSSSSNYQKWRMYYSPNGNALKCVSSDSTVNGYKLVISGSTLSVSNSTYTPVGFFDVSWYTPTTSISYSNFYLAPQQYKYVYPVRTPSNATLSNDWINWYTSSPAKATVNSDGKVTAVSPGTSYLYFTDKITRVSGMCSVFVTQIANGTYLLKSRDTSRFVDIENQTMSNGTNIHQWDFHGENSQKWIFTHLGDGYYSIKSANSTSDYYLGVQNDGTATDTHVVLRTGSLTDGMKWRVSLTTSGSYKITPKTGEANDRVLAVGWYAFNVNGIDIKQRDYVDDGNYKDEWILCTITPDFTNMYIGAFDGDTTMPGILINVKNQFNNNGYFGNSLNSSTKNELIYMLKESDVFSAITHGNQTSIKLTGNVYFSINDVNSISSSDLNHLIFVYLGACKTGEGGGSATNLVNSFYSKGVDNVVGFTISVLIDETSFWTTKFMSNIANGQSIGTAISNADNSIQNDLILGGRSSYTISSRLIKGSTATIPCP